MKQYLLIAAMVLALAGCKRRPFEDGLSGQNCIVQFQADGISVESGTKADIQLPQGSTVRVLAFQRKVPATPDLANDTCKSIKTYVVNADGDLVPSLVNDDGTVKAGEAEGMELSNGKYDFYAYISARKIEADNRTVKGIPHYLDFMSAVVLDKSISHSGYQVDLIFKHKCSKIQFDIKSVTGMITDSLAVDSVVLRKMATAPAGNYKIGGDITATAGAIADTCLLETFVQASDKKSASGFGILLPKTSAQFSGDFFIEVNDTTYVLKASNLPAMSFDKGNHYTFTALVKQGSVSLQLTVVPWGAGDSSTGGMGGGQTIEIGEWGNVDWGGGMGGNLDPITGTIVVSSWTTNPEFATNTGSGQASTIDAWVAKVLNATFLP